MTDKNYEYKERVIADMPDKELKFGSGRISGYVSCFLGVLSFLAVLCYHFPDYLTTSDLRAAYNADVLRTILRVSMWVSLAFGLLTFVLAKKRKLGAIGVLFTVAAFAIGGHQVQVGETGGSSFSLGLDWLILAFIVSAVLFIFLEKVFPKYREQIIFRPEWRLDFIYFCFNHLIITLVLLVANYFVVTVFGWAANSTLQNFVQNLPILVQVLILILCADFVLYWSHRIFHENPRFWKIHAVHHSVEHMDWMAGSRNHVVQTFVDRSLALVPLYLIGADKHALDIYVSFAAFQAVFVHSNIALPFGPLKYIVCTPQYHHWHHSSEKPAIDTNYSVHTPLFDKLFGTYHMPGKHWPAEYGTTKRLPRTFFSQLVYPFKKESP